jgi:PKD repeat protein
MITREQIKLFLQNIASSHYNIHTFGWGDVPDLLAREKVIYPYMMVTPVPSTFEDGYINYGYLVSIADRIREGNQNEVEVDSDTFNIMMQVITQIDNLLYNDVDLVKGQTITPFMEAHRHRVSGHFSELQIRVKYNYDACAIPSDEVPLPLPPPPSCAVANYRVEYENGTLIEAGTIPSGGSKTIEVPDPSICANATWELRDEDGVLLDSGSVASGGSVTIEAPNADLLIRNSLNQTLYNLSLLSGSSGNQTIGDSSIRLEDSVGTLIANSSVVAEGSATIAAPDGTVSVRKSDGVEIYSVDVRSNGTASQNVADSAIANSDASYSVNVLAEGSLVLPDSQINVNSVDSGDVVSVKTIDVNITDGVDPVTPTSVGLVGNTLTIEVPSGGAVMNVDFSADKVTADVGEVITFTDLTDNSPTHWSWRFDNAGVSIAQNPTFSFLTTGFKNITLLAGKVGAGGVEIKNSFIEILLPLLLDAFPNAAAAYSLRKMRAAYTGSAIRVRRSSDNTEQDIGFNGSNGLDTTALTTFVGAGNGFVTTWYDQSGNGRDVTQTSSANQPQIVSSGIVVSKNSKPSLDFDGTNDTLFRSGNFLGGSAASGFAVSSFDNNTRAAREIIYGMQDTSGARYDFLVARQASNAASPLTQNAIDFYVEGTFGSSTFTVTDTNQKLYSMIYENNVVRKLFVNTIDVNSGANNQGILDDGTDFYIGSDIIGDFYIDGKIQEVVIYNANQTANQALIETNINTYYGI